MATTIPEPPKIDPHRSPDQGHSGNGGWRNLVPAGNDTRLALDYSPPPSSTAIWVVLFAITMMFAAFTSALIVRKASQDWHSFTLPSILYFNTLLLLPSSSFFYLLTVTHALHVLGGLGGVIYVIRKLSKLALWRSQLVATARYWHFMGILWLYLLLLLWMKL